MLIDFIPKAIRNFPVMVLTIFAVIIIHTLEKMGLKNIGELIGDFKIPLIRQFMGIVFIHLAVKIGSIIIIMVITVTEGQVKPGRKLIVSV